MMSTGYEGVREIQKRLRIQWDGLPLPVRLITSSSKMLTVFSLKTQRCKSVFLTQTQTPSGIWLQHSWKLTGVDTGKLLRRTLSVSKNCTLRLKTESRESKQIEIVGELNQISYRGSWPVYSFRQSTREYH